MSKITSVTNASSILISNKITRPEAVVDWELKTINSNVIWQCLPIKREERRRIVVLTVESYSRFNLIQYFNGVIGKQMFLKFVLNLIQIMKSCEEKMLNPSNLLLEYEYIFVDPRSENVSCVYWPLVNNKNEHSISEFFRRLPKDFSLYRANGNDYLLEYNSYFEKEIPFSLKVFEKMVKQLLGKEEEPQKSLFTQERTSERVRIGKSDNKKNIAYNPLNVTESYVDLCNLEPKNCSIMNIREPIIQSQVSETTVLIPLAETSVLSYEQTVSKKEEMPQIILENLRTQERVEMKTRELVIGRSKTQSGYVIEGNTAISRSHLILQLDESNKLTARDNSSKNGSKINEKEMTPNIHYFVHDADVLMVADEKLIIHIS